MKTVWVLPKRHSKDKVFQETIKVTVMEKSVDPRIQGVRLLIDNEDLGSVEVGEGTLEHSITNEKVGYILNISVEPISQVDPSHLVSKKENTVNAVTAREMILSGKALKGLCVRGFLNLMNTGVTWLPDNLTIEGGLDLALNPLEKLPKNLYVHGKLDLTGTYIKEIPSCLKVGSHLILENTKLSKLPKDFEVFGNLNISGTDMVQLPEGLIVHNRLIMRRTKITKFPTDMIVHGKITKK